MSEAWTNLAVRSQPEQQHQQQLTAAVAAAAAGHVTAAPTLNMIAVYLILRYPSFTQFFLHFISEHQPNEKSVISKFACVKQIFLKYSFGSQTRYIDCTFSSLP